jgi:hypothetical protein
LVFTDWTNLCSSCANIYSTTNAVFSLLGETLEKGNISSIRIYNFEGRVQWLLPTSSYGALTQNIIRIRKIHNTAV